jgi:hypothetical protein
MQRAGNPKAMAKSKRNSSQRQQQRASFSHTKRHPLLHSQRQARPENDAGGGPDDKTLPSNWDSNEALPLSDTDAEELARVAEEPEQHIDVKPKSRGADYNYLLTQDLIPLHHNVPGMDFLVSSSWILKRCLMATRWLFSWMYFACFGLSTLQSCFTGGNVCSSLCIRPLLCWRLVSTH